MSWFATLFAGTTPLGLHNFIAQYLRYSVQVYGYLLFLADPYPGFLGDRPYGADLVIAPPEPQNRWKTGFRAILAIPVLIVVQVLGYVVEIIAFIAWIVCLFTGGMPLGLRDLVAWIVRFTAADARLRGPADRPLPQLLDRPARVGAGSSRALSVSSGGLIVCRQRLLLTR